MRAVTLAQAGAGAGAAPLGSGNSGSKASRAAKPPLRRVAAPVRAATLTERDPSKRGQESTSPYSSPARRGGGANNIVPAPLSARPGRAFRPGPETPILSGGGGGLFFFWQLGECSLRGELPCIVTRALVWI